MANSDSELIIAFCRILLIRDRFIARSPPTDGNKTQAYTHAPSGM